MDLMDKFVIKSLIKFLNVLLNLTGVYACHSCDNGKMSDDKRSVTDTCVPIPTSEARGMVEICKRYSKSSSGDNSFLSME